jgi:drug/metabolite transporter (DMT)-like permease
MTENQPMHSSTGDGPRFSPDLAIVLLVLIWGSNFSVVKAALSEFSPLAFNATRFVLASAVLALYMAASGTRIRIDKRDVLRLVGLGLLGNVVYQGLFIYGIDGTRAGNAALMLSTVPLIVTVLSVGLKHETISRAGWAGVVLSISGIVIILWGSSRGLQFGSDTMRGDLIMLGSALAWSVYTVLSSPYVQKYGTLPTTAFTMWIGTIGLVAVSTPALLAQNWTSVSAGAWAGLVFSGALSLALAYILWYYGVRHLGSSRTAVYSNTVPVVALLVAWLTLGEVPTLVQVAGTAMIIGGIGLARLQRRPVELPEDLFPPE